ncbi:MAG TPA: cytochrome P450 [Jatrophihabitantaceae bacterium]|jgi:cytochrome P450|nr:cytochrome P450 [Jatrophihabitantaceae bacterium]
MIDTSALEPGAAPRPPAIDLPYRQRLKVLHEFHVGGEIARRTGPVAELNLGPTWLGVPRVVFVTSPRGAHDVLGGFDGTFDKEQVVHVQGRLLAGSNLFNLPHLPWQSRRRAVQPVFTKRNVASYARDIHAVARSSVDDWIGRGEIDLDNATRRLTLEVLGRSVFGMDLGPLAEVIAPHVQRYIAYPTRRATQPVRLPRWWPTRRRARFLAARSALRGLAAEAVRRARSDPTHHAPLVRRLIEATDPETGHGLSDLAIVDDLITFLIAGHDTTATTLAHTLWQLARNPDMQQRVADEVSRLGDRPLTVEDVTALPYTGQVLCETLRLCPAAAAVGRLAMRDAVVDGYRIDAGVNLVVSTYAIQRDPTLWSDPLRFDPDRFEPARAKAIDRWQYLPFGAGPRSCIGDHFAMLEATLALAAIVQRARFTSDQPDFPVIVPFTLVAAGPVRATVTRRSARQQPAVETVGYA